MPRLLAVAICCPAFFRAPAACRVASEPPVAEGEVDGTDDAEGRGEAVGDDEPATDGDEGREDDEGEPEGGVPREDEGKPPEGDEPEEDVGTGPLITGFC